MSEVLQMFIISVFSITQLILIISKHLMLFVNRFCSCKLLSASILIIKTQFSVFFLCEFFSDIPWNNYLLTLPAYHLNKTKHIFSSFVACPALKPFLWLFQKCHGSIMLEYLKTARIYQKMSTSFEILHSHLGPQRVLTCLSGNCVHFASAVRKDPLSVEQFYKTSTRSPFCSMLSFDGVLFPASFCHNLPSTCSRKLSGHVEALRAVLILVFLCLS